MLRYKNLTLILLRRITHQSVVKDLNLLVTSLSILYRGILSRYSCNTEASASELQENYEEIFSRYL